MSKNELIVAVMVAVFGSTGFWAVIQTVVINRQHKKEVKNDKLNAISKGVLATLHKELNELCDIIIEQEYVTQSQFEDLQYMSAPYIELGGDGTLEKKLKIIDKFDLKG